MIDPQYKLRDIVKLEIDHNRNPTKLGLGDFSIEAEIIAIKKASKLEWTEYWVATSDPRIIRGGCWYQFSQTDAHDIILYNSNISNYIVHRLESDYVRFLNKTWRGILHSDIISVVQSGGDISSSLKSDGANCGKCNEYIPYASNGIICYRCKNEKKMFGYE